MQLLHKRVSKYMPSRCNCRPTEKMYLLFTRTNQKTIERLGSTLKLNKNSKSIKHLWKTIKPRGIFERKTSSGTCSTMPTLQNVITLAEIITGPLFGFPCLLERMPALHRACVGSARGPPAVITRIYSSLPLTSERWSSCDDHLLGSQT